MLTLLVASIEWLMARQVTFCGTPDSCAYLALGESLSRHQGFRENFLFQYQFVAAHLPTNGIEYWRAGTSFLLLLAQPFGGVTLHSSLVVTMLAGICLALAAWRIAIDSTGDRSVACASYLVCLVLPPLWYGALSPDSALFYGAFVAWFLALLRVRFRSYWADLGALVCVAGVSLIRNDAILLLVPLVCVLWMRHRQRQARGASLRYVLLLLAGFVMANLPTPLIDHAVLGTAFPPATGGALYLMNLSDLGSYGAPLTLHTMLAHGLGALLKLRAETLPLVIYRIVWVVIGFGAIFLSGLVPGFVSRHVSARQPALPELTGGLTFLATIVAVYGLVLPAVGVFSALRSFVGLLPLTAALIVAGILQLGTTRSLRLALLGSVFVFYLLSGTMALRRGLEETNKAGNALRVLAAALEHEGIRPESGAVIMTSDSAQLSVTTGYAAVPLPTNGGAAVQQAIHDLKPSRLVVHDSTFEQLPGELRQAPNERVAGTDFVIVDLGNAPTL